MPSIWWLRRFRFFKDQNHENEANLYHKSLSSSLIFFWLEIDDINNSFLKYSIVLRKPVSSDTWDSIYN